MKSTVAEEYKPPTLTDFSPVVELADFSPTLADFSPTLAKFLFSASIYLAEQRHS